MTEPKYNIGDLVVNVKSHWASIVSRDSHRHCEIGWCGMSLIEDFLIII